MAKQAAKFTEADIKRAVAGARKSGCREVRVFVTDNWGRKIEVHATLGDAPGSSGNEWDDAV